MSAVQVLSETETTVGSFVDVFRADPLVRIGMIKAGLSAGEVKTMLAGLALQTGEAMVALGLSPATVNRKVARGEALAPDDSERVLGLASLIGQVQIMVEESGDPEGFDAERWLSAWLREPVPALGGQRPIEFLDTMEGQHLVARTLGQIQSGAYA